MSNNECSIARIRLYFEPERHILIVMLCTIHLMSFYCGNEVLVYLPINNNNNNDNNNNNNNNSSSLTSSKDYSMYIIQFSWR